MISETALAKIHEYQKCMDLKQKYNVKDFYIYSMSHRWGYGISTSPKWRTDVRFTPYTGFIGLKGIFERMTGNKYKVWYIDKEIEFDHLDNFLEYYYITKIAGI